jgi:hypothetical protein
MLNLSFAVDYWVDPVALVACIVVDGVETREAIETMDIARLVEKGYRLHVSNEQLK